jgi:hypothetical protein
LHVQAGVSAEAAFTGLGWVGVVGSGTPDTETVDRPSRLVSMTVPRGIFV